MIEILLCFTIVLLIIHLLQKYRKKPPGPYGLPIVGYYPFMGEDPIETIHELSKRHRDVMSIKLLGETYWILNSVEAVEEAFVAKGDYFAGRSKSEYSLNLQFGRNSFVLNEGEEWKTQLKFVLGHLSELGMGKSHFEVTIHDLMDDVERYIESKNGEPHDYQAKIANFVWNIGTTLIYSTQHKEDDEDYLRLTQCAMKLLSSLKFLSLILTGNIHKYWQRYNTNVEEAVKETYKTYVEYARQLVQERMKTFDENNCRDLLDYWIKESSGSNREYFKYEYVADNISAMIFASQTPSSFIYHSLYHMATNPDIQEKVYQEIVDAIGVDRDFCYMDKDRLPYTQAVIAEIHRFHALASLSAVHWNRGATKLRGYDVPKRQKVIANIYTLSRDPNHFKNPEQFDPNNFLDENGWYKANRASIPFGVGVRKCLGMKLAEVEIFLAFVRLMRKFKWIKWDSTASNVGNVRLLMPFRVSAKRRQ